MPSQKFLLGSLLILALFSFRDAHHRSSSRRWFHPHPDGEVYLVVVKSNYELQVYDKDGWYATYPAVFGSKSLDDKMVQGDRKTPEGTFHIRSKRPHEKWSKIMDLDFPTAADIAKFNDRKARGLIPRNAKIGDGIAIHGTWPHDERAVDAYQMWTNGCVSLKNEDMDEVYSITPVGAKVIIQH
jgi:murein L,D-transpeptidase YafK